MTLADAARAMLIGAGATALLDLWALFAHRVLGLSATSWSMVGRWIGNMPRGRFVHARMTDAAPIPGETAIGWTAHYLIGAGYGLLLPAIVGVHWLAIPTILPPLLLSWALLAAPFLVMMPGMGAGLAGSKTPNPNVARLKSVLGHSAFGIGMYATAALLADPAPRTIMFSQTFFERFLS